MTEVRQAGAGRRLLRVAASSLFAEHAAPGLIGLFAGRARDLDVELGVHRPRDLATLLRTRTVDVAGVLGRAGIPESQQQIFQSDSAALEEARRGRGVALAVHFTVSRDLAAGTLGKVAGPHANGVWSIGTLAERGVPAAAGELTRFITTPRATQAVLRGSGVTVGRFTPSIHVTLRS